MRTVNTSPYVRVKQNSVWQMGKGCCSRQNHLASNPSAIHIKCYTYTLMYISVVCAIQSANEMEKKNCRGRWRRQRKWWMGEWMNPKKTEGLKRSLQKKFSWRAEHSALINYVSPLYSALTFDSLRHRTLYSQICTEIVANRFHIQDWFPHHSSLNNHLDPKRIQTRTKINSAKSKRRVERYHATTHRLTMQCSPRETHETHGRVLGHILKLFFSLYCCSPF